MQFARFVLHTQAFIFVADPFTMPDIIGKLPPQLQTMLQPYLKIAQRRRAVESLNSIIDIFKSYHRYSDEARLPDTPIAIMLSKADLLKGFNPPNSYRFMTNPPYGSNLDLKDINVVDAEVRAFLQACNQGDLLATTNKFKQVKFFATSATGEPPDGNGLYSKVEPCRCLDPVLWILHRLGIIRAK